MCKRAVETVSPKNYTCPAAGMGRTPIWGVRLGEEAGAVRVGEQEDYRHVTEQCRQRREPCMWAQFYTPRLRTVSDYWVRNSGASELMMLRSFARSAVRKSTATASPSSIATTAVMPSFRQMCCALRIGSRCHVWCQSRELRICTLCRRKTTENGSRRVRFRAEQLQGWVMFSGRTISSNSSSVR